MYTTVFLTHLKQHLKIANLLSSLPFEWDSAAENLVRLQSPVKRCLLRLQLLLNLFHAILQLCMALFSPLSTGQKLAGMTFSAIYLTAVPVRWNWELDTKAMGLLQTLINFDKATFPGKVKSERGRIYYKIYRNLHELKNCLDQKYKKSLADKMISLMLPLILWSTVTVPLCTGVVVFFKPCLPPLLGSMLPKCRNIGENKTIDFSIYLKLGLATFETLMFYPVCVAGAFHCIHVLIAGSVGLWNYIRIMSEW